MKKALRKSVGLYHIVNGERVAGSYLGLSGDCSGLSGNLDECEITDEERAAGVVIEELIK